MARVLVTHSYFLRFDKKQWQTQQPYAPLATLYACSILRNAGHEVAFFDVMFAEKADEIKAQLSIHQPDYFLIYDDGFNYLTKMCLTNMRHAAYQMARLAKQFGCRVIVSSSDSTDHYREYLAEGADYILIGEADATLPQLVDALEKNEDVVNIPGTAFLLDGEPVKTSKRKVLTDLDSIPYPAWDLLNINPYREAWLQSKGYFSINMSTTRGCPFKCNWCAKPIYGNRYNSRSPENVINELLLLKARFRFDHVWFCDDIFGLKPGWVQSFSELVKLHGLQFKFKIQSRADLLTDPDDVKALASAGCENVWIGAESGSQRILDAMDKGTTLEQISTCTALLKQNGIKPSFFIQFGYPSETRADIALTIDMINRLLPYEIGISVSYPLPGTVFFERVKADLKTKANWTDSDEMALMFKNTYPPAFYKQLHRYVHRNYHLHLAKHRLQSARKSITGIRSALAVLYHAPMTLLERFRLNQAEN